MGTGTKMSGDIAMESGYNRIEAKKRNLDELRKWLSGGMAEELKAKFAPAVEETDPETPAAEEAPKEETLEELAQKLAELKASTDETVDAAALPTVEDVKAALPETPAAEEPELPPKKKTFRSRL